jgi:glycosyltransferase involved in cell wall biosynthesis
MLEQQPVSFDVVDGGVAPAFVTLHPRHRVSFVLPAYNEAENIEAAIHAAVEAGERHCAEFEVVVVDDGSHDATADLTRRIATSDDRVWLVQHARNLGYGQALSTGFQHATLDHVFFTDADNQFDLNEFPLLLDWADRADVVAGYRRKRRDPPVRRLNAWAWNRLVRMLFCVPVRDVDCAFKLFRRSALRNLEIESRGAMINTEIMVKLARGGGFVVEVGVTHRPRVAGRASGAGMRVIARALRELVVMYRRLADVTPEPDSGVLDQLAAPASGPM